MEPSEASSANGIRSPRKLLAPVVWRLATVLAACNSMGLGDHDGCVLLGRVG
jgi:hypothetical protein